MITDPLFTIQILICRTINIARWHFSSLRGIMSHWSYLWQFPLASIYVPTKHMTPLHRPWHTFSVAGSGFAFYDFSPTLLECLYECFHYLTGSHHGFSEICAWINKCPGGTLADTNLNSFYNCFISLLVCSLAHSSRPSYGRRHGFLNFSRPRPLPIEIPRYPSA